MKGYRLWCVEPGQWKIVISRDVVLWENELPFKRDAGSVRITTAIEVEPEKSDEGLADDCPAPEISEGPP